MGSGGARGGSGMGGGGRQDRDEPGPENLLSGESVRSVSRSDSRSGGKVGGYYSYERNTWVGGKTPAPKIDVSKIFQQTPITSSRVKIEAGRPISNPVRKEAMPVQTEASPSQNYGGYSPHLSSMVTGFQNEDTLRKQSESVKEKRQETIDKQVAHWKDRPLGDFNPTTLAAEYIGLDPYEVASHLTKPEAGNVTLDLPWDASFKQRADQSANKALDLYNKTNTAQKFASGNPFAGIDAIAQTLGLGLAGTLHQGIHGVQNILNQTTPGAYPNFADWWGNMVGLKMGLLGQPPIEQGD